MKPDTRSEYTANLLLQATLSAPVLAILLVSVDGVPKDTLVAVDPYVCPTAQGVMRHVRLCAGGHLYVEAENLRYI